MSSILINLQVVREQIVQAAELADRAFTEIQLLAVSKKFDAETVLEAARAGQRAFGENYVQEGVDKIARIAELAPELKLEWHFIGPLQSNKTRLVAEHFDWVHSVDRYKVAERLSAQRPAGMAPLNICFQINSSGELSKSGAQASAIAALAKQVAELPNLRLRGLMTIPEALTTTEQQRAAFRPVRLLLEALNGQGFALDTLSMGMSADLASAILEGSTIVRVGTAIFGARNYD